MAKEIDKYIGTGWHTDLAQLRKMEPHIEKMLPAFRSIKRANKEKLAAYIAKHEGIELSPDFIFDVQVKRLHEYKRQLLNAFAILYFYYEIKDGEITDFPPTAFIFGAKAAPGYYNAKAIIKYINEIAKLVNNDPDVNKVMKVVFVQNYNVSYAEKIVCAADVSEQISMAGMEASGTSNMKFMLNGTSKKWRQSSSTTARRRCSATIPSCAAWSKRCATAPSPTRRGCSKSFTRASSPITAPTAISSSSTLPITSAPSSSFCMTTARRTSTESAFTTWRRRANSPPTVRSPTMQTSSGT